MHHCWTELEHDEKWRNREVFEIPNKRKSSVGQDDDDASSGEEEKRSPTPNSVAKSKRPDGSKKDKGTKAGDNDLKESLEAIVNARKAYA